MKKKFRSAAILTIKDAATMTPQGRKRIYAWILKQARFFKWHCKELAPQFTARYLYDHKKKA